MLKKILKRIKKYFILQRPGALTWEEWEDWYAENKKKYPIKYFLSETIPRWFAVKITMRLSHYKYWLVSHTIRRYHKLDLRQPFTDTEDDYRWGWVDEDAQLLFANFNILCNYVKVINSTDYFFDYSDESLKKLEENECYEQIKHLKEVKALYEYWTVHRKEKLRKRLDLLRDWSDNKKIDTDKTRWDALQKCEKEIDDEEEEMLIRLIKIRKGLWT